MNKETLEALKDSIAHWKRMREFSCEERREGKEDPYSDHCALCKRFNGPNDCFRMEEDCPVYQKTGKLGCHKTPWLEAEKYWHGHIDHLWQSAADEMIAFLEGLLPKD